VSQQSGPEMRIGDAEREAAVTALGEHFAAGRLTKEEYDERAGQAWAARTASALWPLFADLPRPQSPRPDPSAAGPRASGQGPGRGWGHDRAPLGWLRAAVLPVFLVLVGLTVLTHLPVILLALVAFLVWAKLGRHRARHWHPHAGYRYSDHRGYRDDSDWHRR
jgi:hypothetical protein